MSVGVSNNVEQSKIVFSIIIGLVSTEDSERIFEVLTALHKQEGEYSFEVILADRTHNKMIIAGNSLFKHVRIFHYAKETTLPALRTYALDQALGKYVIVIEDHTVPALNWLEEIYNAFQISPINTVAVGGCVENGMTHSVLDWATFFCEYSNFLYPVDEGINVGIPGMNIAYKRNVLITVDRTKLLSGFWESTAHPPLLEQGLNFITSNKIIIYHKKKFTFKFFLKQRYFYSKYFAGQRVHNRSKMIKLIFGCCTLLLPIILIYRVFSNIIKKKRLKMMLFKATPFLLVFYAYWALGEMSGYIFGAKNALEKIE
tara:strand:- start:15710 stop:16654 length:945 start_codon:yes stop_codon:yes gene_type:complete